MDTSGNNLDTPSQNNDTTPKKSSKKRKQQSNSSTKPVKKNRKLEFKDISGSSKPGSTLSDTASASASASGSGSTPNIINIPKHLLPKDVNSGIIVEINELPSFFNTLFMFISD